MKLDMFKCLVLTLIGASLTITQSALGSYSLDLSDAEYVGRKAPADGHGDLVYHFSYKGGGNGLLGNSYDYSAALGQINYLGGDYADGTYIVVKDRRGRAYSWDVSDWNGTDQIDFDFGRRFRCKDIYVYGAASSVAPSPNSIVVPEPSTVAAAALLLVPLGVQAIRRIAHRRKPQP